MTDRRRLLPWLAAAAVFLATLAVFWPAVHNGFVSWDDEGNLTSNLAYRGLGWEQLRWAFTTAHDGNYMPLTWLSFGLNYLLGAMDPSGYHLTNILLQAANAALFFFVCLRLLARGEERAQDGAHVWTAGLAALLWAIHPMRVESVAWATERKDTLSGLFYLSTVLLYLRACEDDGRQDLWRRLSLGAYLLSLLSKGVGVTLPFALLVLDAYPLRRLPADPRRWFSPDSRGVLLEKLPFLALALPAGIVNLLTQRHVAWVPSIEEYGLPQRAAEAAYGLTFYLRTALFPKGLIPLHEIPFPFDPFAQPFVLSAVSTTLLLWAAVAARRRRPWLTAAFVFYAATIFPTLGLFQFGGQLVADHYSYLPMLGWALLGGAGALALARRSDPRERWALAGGCAAALLCLAAATRAQLPAWRDSESLWSHTLRVQPDHSTAHFKLGLIRWQKKDARGAAGHYLLSARAKPTNPLPHLGLAYILDTRGRFVDAERHFRMALNVGSSSTLARHHLAAFLMRRGRMEEARPYFEAAMTKTEGFSLDLAAPLQSEAEPPRGPSTPARRPMPADPRRAASARYASGVRHTEAARWDDAVREYEAALRLDPDLTDAHNNLGSALANLGRMREAAAEFEAAVRLAPRDTMARYNLGNAYLLEKRFPEAAAQYEAVLRLDPSHPKARQHLEMARFYLKRPPR